MDAVICLRVSVLMRCGNAWYELETTKPQE